MVALGMTELRKNVAECIGRVVYGNERIAIKKNGKIACAIISIDDLELLEAIEDKLDIEAAEIAMKQEETVSWNDLKREHGLR